jgi:hypothetical protein
MSETWGEAIDGAFRDIADDIADSFAGAWRDLWGLPPYDRGSSGGSRDDKDTRSGGGCRCPGRCCCH